MQMFDDGDTESSKEGIDIGVMETSIASTTTKQISAEMKRTNESGLQSTTVDDIKINKSIIDGQKHMSTMKRGHKVVESVPKNEQKQKEKAHEKTKEGTTKSTEVSRIFTSCKGCRDCRSKYQKSNEICRNEKEKNH